MTQKTEYAVIDAPGTYVTYATVWAVAPTQEEAIQAACRQAKPRGHWTVIIATGVGAFRRGDKIHRDAMGRVYRIVWQGGMREEGR